MNKNKKRVIARSSTGNRGLVIEVFGNFNLQLHGEFRAAYEGQGQRYNCYAINLRNCTSLDSAGLGMLLLLREFSGLGKPQLLITHCSPEVRQVLHYASFDQLFTVH